MADLIRAACLTHYADVARSVGIDPAKMLKSVGLPASGLSDPDIKIRSGDVRRLLEASATAAEIDDFGLRLAERGGLSNLGPVALVAREQPTVGAAMEALGRYIHTHNESLRLRVHVHRCRQAGKEIGRQGLLHIRAWRGRQNRQEVLLSGHR